MCPECRGEGIREREDDSFVMVPCSRCNHVWVPGDGGRAYIPFSYHGLARFVRVWGSDCMVLSIIVNRTLLDQVRIGWN